jgi:hypothetical protein
MRELDLPFEGSSSSPYFLFDLIEPGSSAIGRATGLALFSKSFFSKSACVRVHSKKNIFKTPPKIILRIHFVDLLRVLSCESFQEYPPSKTQKKHQTEAN